MRIAIVGFGAIAPHHTAVLRDLGADIVASVNRSEAGRDRARVEGCIPRTYAVAEEMAEAEQPDGIVVSVTNHLQAEMTRRLLPFGIPLLVEKPPGTSLDEAHELAKRAEHAGVPVMVGLNRRYYGHYLEGIERLGGLDEIRAVSIEWSEVPRRVDPESSDVDVVRRQVFTHSLHGLDLLVFFGGSLERSAVIAVDRSDPSGDEVRWQMAVDGVTDRGAIGRFWSNWDVAGRWRVVVDARDGRMVSAPLESATLHVRGLPEQPLPLHPRDRRFKPGFHGQAEAFLSMVSSGSCPPWPACDLAGALPAMTLAQRLTDACTAASRCPGP
jgi:predicted dehydrogenase